MSNVYLDSQTAKRSLGHTVEGGGKDKMTNESNTQTKNKKTAIPQ